MAHEFGVAAAARLSAPVAAVPAPVSTSAGPGRIHPGRTADRASGGDDWMELGIGLYVLSLPQAKHVSAACVSGNGGGGQALVFCIYRVYLHMPFRL